MPLYSPPIPFPYMQTNAHPIPSRSISLPQTANPTVPNRGPCDKPLFGSTFWKRDPQALRAKKRVKEQPSFLWVHRHCWASMPQNSTGAAQDKGWEEVSRDSCGSQHGPHWTVMLVSNAERYSHVQGRRGSPYTHHYSWPGALWTTTNTSDLWKIPHFLWNPLLCTFLS